MPVAAVRSVSRRPGQMKFFQVAASVNGFQRAAVNWPFSSNFR
jgi:hypothetical protein